MNAQNLTPEARARAIAEWAEDKGFTSPRQLEGRIAAAITDAVMAERARCIKIVRGQGYQ